MPRAKNGEIFSEWFAAKITEVGAETGSAPCNGIPHAWTTLQPCPDQQKNKTPVAGYPVVVGTVAKMPAFALDGSAAAVDDIVLMRQRGLDSTGNPVMEFMSIGGGGSSGGGNARVKIATPDGDGKIGILQTFTGSGLVLSFSDSTRVYVHEVNGFTSYLTVGAIFLAQELAAGIYGVQLDPTAVVSAICDETGLTVTTRM